MGLDSERFWDERYRTEEAVPERGPASFLVEHRHLLPSTGRALDVAMGTGRNALYLASLGYEVTGIDISGVAVERCRREATRLGLPVEAVKADLDSYALPEAAYDVVIDFYYLQRDLAPQIEAALRPGGVLVFESFTTEQRRFGWGPQQEEFLLRPGELRSLFPALEELAYREGVMESERGMKAVAALVARKPQLASAGVEWRRAAALAAVRKGVARNADRVQSSVQPGGGATVRAVRDPGDPYVLR